MDVSRRDFILSTTTAAGTGLTGTAATAAPTLLAQAGAPTPREVNLADPAFKFDLVIANGDVLDPAQKLRGRRDIGIKYGQIA